MDKKMHEKIHGCAAGLFFCVLSRKRREGLGCSAVRPHPCSSSARLPQDIFSADDVPCQIT